MKKVGVTGGIGSGKTMVCSVFEHLGIPVYSSDNRARVLMEQSPEVRKPIIDLLGKKAYHAGKLNKQLLTRRLFDDPDLREKINRIVHPVVFEDFLAWSEKYRGKHYVIQEAAIIFESGADHFLDQVINVYAPVRIRIDRLVKRDRSNAREIRKKMKSQMSEKERRQRADYTLVNDGKRMILPQILKIHKDLMK